LLSDGARAFRKIACPSMFYKALGRALLVIFFPANEKTRKKTSKVKERLERQLGSSA